MLGQECGDCGPDLALRYDITACTSTRDPAEIQELCAQLQAARAALSLFSKLSQVYQAQFGWPCGEALAHAVK